MVVLQQHKRLSSEMAGSLAMLGGIDVGSSARLIAIPIRIVEEPQFILSLQNPTTGLIDLLHRDLALLK